MAAYGDVDEFTGEKLAPTNPRTGLPYDNQDRFNGNKTKSLNSLDKKFKKRADKIDKNTEAGKIKFSVLESQYKKEYEKKMGEKYTPQKGILFGHKTTPWD